MAAYYRVTDLVVRRDWYSLANVFAENEVAEADMQRIAVLLAGVGIDELVLLDAQLQLAGLGVAKPLTTMSASADGVGVVAPALELSRRREYLQQLVATKPTVESRYRRSIEKTLRQAVSYRYVAADQSIVTRATHRMIDSLRRGVVDEDERSDLLRSILERDPQLIVGLVDDGYVSLRDAGIALDGSAMSSIDAIRVLMMLPELAKAERLDVIAAGLDLGAIAQLRDETSDQRIGEVLERRARVLLDTAVENEQSGVSRYGGLYGNDYEYVAVRLRRIRTALDTLDDPTLEVIRGAISSLDDAPAVRSLRTMPVVGKYDALEALLFVRLLGERFEWARAFADKLDREYGETWFTEAQRWLLFDDAASLLADTDDREYLDRLNSQLYRIGMRFALACKDTIYLSHIKRLVELLAQSDTVRTADLLTLAYLVPAKSDAHTQAARRLDDQAVSRLLSAAIDGSLLARGFLQTLRSDDLLYLMLRWGSRVRNGYLLLLVSEVSKRRYDTLRREADSRGLAVMSLSDIAEIIEVLSRGKCSDSTLSEQSLAFLGQLIKTYGKQQAALFVNNAGIRQAKDLESLSPFYVRLLVDMGEESLSFDKLKGLEATMTYEQAQEFRKVHYTKIHNVASDVVGSMRRALKLGESAAILETA